VRTRQQSFCLIILAGSVDLHTMDLGVSCNYLYELVQGLKMTAQGDVCRGCKTALSRFCQAKSL
jgi:hypothetical protein